MILGQELPKNQPSFLKENEIERTIQEKKRDDLGFFSFRYEYLTNLFYMKINISK